MSQIKAIRLLEEEIEIYKFFKGVLVNKYNRKFALRYKCEINRLDRLINDTKEDLIGIHIWHTIYMHYGRKNGIKDRIIKVLRSNGFKDRIVKVLRSTCTWKHLFLSR